MTNHKIVMAAIKKVFGKNTEVEFRKEGVTITEKLGKNAWHNFVLTPQELSLVISKVEQDYKKNRLATPMVK